MSNRNRINKLISGVLVVPMVLGISNQAFENLRVFASSGEQKERVLGESEYRVVVEQDNNNAETLNENDIDRNGLKYELKGEEAFVEKCTDEERKEVTIPSHVRKDDKIYKVIKIGYCAFSGCSGLRGVEIPEGVIKIDDFAFSGCSGLKSVTIPNSVEEIGVGAFAWCIKLTNVEILGSVAVIDKNAFSNCSELTSVKILEGVTEIREKAFDGCNNLTEVIVTDSTVISKDAFPSCVEIKIIRAIDENDIDKNGVRYELKGEEATFVECTEKEIQEVTIPSFVKKDGKVYTVTVIGSSAFSGCSGLTKIRVPEVVRLIGISGIYTFPYGIKLEEYEVK